MSLSAKVGSVWKDGATLHAKVSGAWKTVSSGWLKVGGVWKQFYTALSAVVSGTLTVVEAIPSPPTAHTISAIAGLTLTGTAPYTYSWSYTGSPSSVSSATASTFTISLSAGFNLSRTGTVWCEVSDSYGNTVTTEAVPWSLTLYTLE